MSEMKTDEVRTTVREHYGNIARGARIGCAPGCCSSVGTAAATLGYTTDETATVVGVSVSSMKSRVQRGRARLRQLFEACCEIALDAREQLAPLDPDHHRDRRDHDERDPEHPHQSR